MVWMPSAPSPSTILYDATPRGEEVDALLARLTTFSGSVIYSNNTGTCPSS